MAHPEQVEFCTRIKNKFPDFFKNKNVLDVGSLDINGNNRYLFQNCSYTGVDVAREEMLMSYQKDTNIKHPMKAMTLSYQPSVLNMICIMN